MTIPNTSMPGYGHGLPPASLVHQPQTQPPMTPSHLQNGHPHLQHASLMNQINPAAGLHQTPQPGSLQHPQADQLQQLQQRAIHLASNQATQNSPQPGPINAGPTVLGNSTLAHQQQHQPPHHQQQQPPQQITNNIPNVAGNPMPGSYAGYNGSAVSPQHFQPINPHQPQQPQHQHLISGQINPNPSANQIVSSFPTNTVMTTHIQSPAGVSPMPNSQQMHVSPIHNMVGMQNMAAINQPVTSTILPQSESRTNIPIYQQQR